MRKIRLEDCSIQICFSLFIIKKSNNLFILNIKRYTMNKRINIGVSREIYERLAKYGRFGESYSDVINRLLNELEKKK